LCRIGPRAHPLSSTIPRDVHADHVLIG
jgi:hypothetical protein